MASLAKYLGPVLRSLFLRGEEVVDISLTIYGKALWKGTKRKLVEVRVRGMKSDQ